MASYDGQGCAHCPYGSPALLIVSEAGEVCLCIGCALKWFPGHDETWLRARLTRHNLGATANAANAADYDDYDDYDADGGYDDGEGECT